MATPITDPAVIRILLHYREAVARLTERAYRDLAALGVDEPAVHLRRTLTRRPRLGTRPPR